MAFKARLHGHALAGFRVVESHLAAEELQPLARPLHARGGAAVFPVAENGRPHGGAVDAQLVGAAGERFQGEKAHLPVGVVDDHIVR